MEEQAMLPVGAGSIVDKTLDKGIALAARKVDSRMMTMKEARKLCSIGNMEKIAEAIRIPAEQWGGRCHEISLKIVRSGLLGQGRVARGWADHVPGQHSWIVLGQNPYDTTAIIADPTIWHYLKTAPHIQVLRNSMTTHEPHGWGSILMHGKPAKGDGPVIELTGRDKLSHRAKTFLDMLGPLDRTGWSQLAHAPVAGWPAKEILTAMSETPGLGVLIPIDHVGMMTDLNPRNLYW